VLAAMPLFWLLSMLARHRQQSLVEAGFQAAAAKASSLGEAVSQALTVKALGLEPEMERRFKEKLAEGAWTGYRASNLGGLVSSSGQVLQHLTALVIVYVGARAIIAGEMSIGALIAATILAARVLAPMRQVVGAWQQLHTVRSAFARLDDMMNEPIELSGQPAPALPINGRIRFEDVAYRYGDEDGLALDGVDLDIQPGQTLGVIGPPGSGKSTLAKLLLGLDQPASGRVLIDDLDVRLWSPAALRQQIGVVPQEVQLFAGSIAENIGLGAADHAFERIVAAARFYTHKFSYFRNFLSYYELRDLSGGERFSLRSPGVGDYPAPYRHRENTSVHLFSRLSFCRRMRRRIFRRRAGSPQSSYAGVITL
jgi:ABC-type bacteriocin/lantibiotic exporter with double-glycine peptidase domain